MGPIVSGVDACRNGEQDTERLEDTMLSRPFRQAAGPLPGFGSRPEGGPFLELRCERLSFASFVPVPCGLGCPLVAPRWYLGLSGGASQFNAYPVA